MPLADELETPAAGSAEQPDHGALIARLSQVLIRQVAYVCSAALILAAGYLIDRMLASLSKDDSFFDVARGFLFKAVGLVNWGYFLVSSSYRAMVETRK